MKSQIAWCDPPHGREPRELSLTLVIGILPAKSGRVKKVARKCLTDSGKVQTALRSKFRHCRKEAFLMSDINVTLNIATACTTMKTTEMTETKPDSLLTVGVKLLTLALLILTVKHYRDTLDVPWSLISPTGEADVATRMAGA